MFRFPSRSSISTLKHYLVTSDYCQWWRGACSVWSCLKVLYCSEPTVIPSYVSLFQPDSRGVLKDSRVSGMCLFASQSCLQGMWDISVDYRRLYSHTENLYGYAIYALQFLFYIYIYIYIHYIYTCVEGIICITGCVNLYIYLLISLYIGAIRTLPKTIIVIPPKRIWIGRGPWNPCLFWDQFRCLMITQFKAGSDPSTTNMLG